MATTMATSIDEILKEDIMRGICVESLVGPDDGNKDVGVPVYKKLGGLPNLGKTYFYCQDELERYRKWVEAQMVQKYGAEIYGASAQMTKQSSNGTASGSAKGSAVQNGGSLISCKVSPYLDLTHLALEAKQSKRWQKFYAAKEKLKTFLNGKDDAWRQKVGFKTGEFSTKGRELVGVLDAFVQADDNNPGPANMDNWKEFVKLMKDKTWQNVCREDDEFQELYEEIVDIWDLWVGKDVDRQDQDHLAQGRSLKGEFWNPYLTMRIDIQTNFDESWYKRKFKSGFLNKVIDTVKTGIHSNASDLGGKSSDFKNKKFSSDQMEDSDKRKLDSLQWKMTNKVAKDYISMLLGWSREKKYKEDADGNPKPTQEKMTRNEAFGAEMAKKALDNRGILGRLKQKIFSGSQSSNVISVCFQMADFRDGWKNETPEPEPTSESTILEIDVDALIERHLIGE